MGSFVRLIVQWAKINTRPARSDADKPANVNSNDINDASSFWTRFLIRCNLPVGLYGPGPTERPTGGRLFRHVSPRTRSSSSSSWSSSSSSPWAAVIMSDAKKERNYIRGFWIETARSSSFFIQGEISTFIGTWSNFCWVDLSNEQPTINTAQR